MDSLELFKILFLSNQIHAINKILGALRNEDFDLNAQVACNKFELNNKIQSQNWDVVLCSEDSPISIETVKETIKSHNLELPIIFLTEERASLKTTDLLSIGVNDCLPILEKNRIISAIKREVGLQRLNIRYRALQLDFNEVEKRHQAIMDASSSPLAYIQEGVHLYCNESYAQLFPHFSLKKVKQSLFLDLFSGNSRERLKSALSKNFTTKLKLTVALDFNQHDSRLNHSELILSFTHKLQGPCLSTING